MLRLARVRSPRSSLLFRRSLSTRQTPLGSRRLSPGRALLAITGTGLTAAIAYHYFVDSEARDSAESRIFPIGNQIHMEKIVPEEQRAISLWKPPSRAEMVQKLQNSEEEFDLVVIGGGATGCGVVLDAASRGLKVALVERDDFAAGTSSKSTKLVHGGVRYLEKAFMNFDKEQYDLVQEALSERFTVLKIAPYLATQLPIMCPIYKWWQVPYYWAGCKAYDLVAGNRGLETSYFLTRSKAMEQFPMLKPDNLCGAIVYYDGQQNDSRMNTVLALTAAYHGAVIANHVEVKAVVKRKVVEESENGSKESEKICGVEVCDEFTGKRWTIRAKGVINATGPFADGIRKMDEPDCRQLIAPSAGTHIVLPHYFSPEHMGLIDPSTSDGRVIFFLPWEGNTVAGTTDSPTDVTYEPMPTEQEIQFILNEVSHYLKPEIKVRRGDVLSAWAGIRPLVRNPNAADTASLVRNHLIHVSPSGLLTIAGGKWTTYRKMAEETVDEAILMFGLQPKYTCDTENIMLIGSHNYSATSYIRLTQLFGMETEVAKHLLRNYGDRAYAVACLASNTFKRWPIMGRRLAYPYPIIEAEVRYACQREWACTAVDVLARRTRLAFLNAAAAYEALPRVIEIMTEEFKWDKERQKKEYERAVAFLKTMGFDTEHVSSRAAFQRDELETYRSAFNSLDLDKNGVVDVKDIQNWLEAHGWKGVKEETVRDWVHEINTNRNGVVEFNEFLEMMLVSKDRLQPFSLPNMQTISTERSGGGV